MTETSFHDNRPEGGLSSEEKTMAMLCHLAAFSGFIGIPFGHILGPLIIWLIKKDSSPFVDAHGKESLNFQISWTIYMFVSAILILVFIGILLLFALAISMLVLVILAAVAANDGRMYRYPLTIRFLT